MINSVYSMIPQFEHQLFDELNLSVHSFDRDTLTWEYLIVNNELELLFTYGIDTSLSIYMDFKHIRIFSYFSFGLLTLRINDGKICAVFENKTNVSIDLENMHVEIVTQVC